MMTKGWLNTLDSEEYLQLQMNFSSRTSSLDFQKALEDNIDKRIGRVYGPPSGKILKVFLDDLNMPTVSYYKKSQHSIQHALVCGFLEQAAILSASC